MTTRIITGNCRAVLREMDAESVHCVVTSLLSMVQALAHFIKRVAPSKIFIGIGKCANTPNPAAIALEFSITNEFCSVFSSGCLETAQLKNDFGIAALHPQKREQSAKQAFRAFVRCLKSIKRPAASRTGLFAVAPSIQLCRQQLDCRLVGHPDLDTSLIRWRDAIASRRRPFDADIALAINNPSEVSIKNNTTEVHDVVTIP